MNCPICDLPYKQETMDGLTRHATCTNRYPYAHVLKQEWWMFHFGGVRPMEFQPTHCLFVAESETGTIVYEAGKPKSIRIKDDEETIEIDAEILDWKILPTLIRSIRSNIAFI
jgi:hypothetical protein